MKKRILIFAAVMAIAASMAGCGQKQESKSSSVVDSEATALPAGVTAEPKTQEQIQEELDTFAKDADKNADMAKIEGSKLKSSDSAKADFEGYEVEIKDAVKTLDAEGNPVAVVEFSFKNRTSVVTKFNSVIKVTAVQGEREMPVALTYEAEGYESMTIAQDVETDQTITVQKAFKLVSDSDPFTITVRRSDTASGVDPITKTFELN